LTPALTLGFNLERGEAVFRRWIIPGLVAAGLIVAAPAAGAKPILVAETDKGAWYVIDRVFEKTDDCRLVAAVFVRKKTLPMDIGPVKAITRVMRVCCGAETYRFTSSRFLGPDGRVIYSHQIPDAQQRAVVADPDSVIYKVIKKVCQPGFGDD
jgi:hypothetical protein